MGDSGRVYIPVPVYSGGTRLYILTGIRVYMRWEYPSLHTLWGGGTRVYVICWYPCICNLGVPGYIYSGVTRIYIYTLGVPAYIYSGDARVYVFWGYQGIYTLGLSRVYALWG